MRRVKMKQRKLFGKTGFIAILAAVLCLSLSLFAISITGAAADTIDDVPAADVLIDVNGTDAKLEAAAGVKINTNTDAGLKAALGLFPYATDETVTGVQFGEIPEGSVATVTFKNAYKASNYGGVGLRLIMTGGITAYALDDENLANPAGTVSVNGENIYATLAMNAGVLADEDGYIKGFKIHRDSGSNNLFLDGVNLYLDYTVDADGSSAWFDVGGRLGSHTYDNNPGLNVFNGDGKTDFMWTESSHADSEISVKLANPVKAADYDTVEMKIVISQNPGVAQNRILTAYALSDTDCAYPAGYTHIFGNVMKYFTVSAKKIADKDGYIRGFKFKRTGLDSGNGQFFVDYLKFTKNSDKEHINVTTPLSDGSVGAYNGIWFEVDGTDINKPAVATKDLGVLDSNDARVTWTEGEMAGKTVTVRFGVPVKAEGLGYVGIRLAVGSAFTLEGYALSDTEFARSAGKVVSVGGNETVVLLLDSAVLADEDGYIRGFNFRRTAGEGNGQYFTDGIELRAAQIAVDEIDDDVNLDMDKVSAWVEVKGVKGKTTDDTYADLFGGDGSTMISFTDNLGEAAIDVRFGKKYKADAFVKGALNLVIGNNLAEGTENTITLTAYALGDESLAHPAGSVAVSESGNIRKVLRLETSVLAENGYIGGFRLVKTQTNAEQVGQLFFDNVVLKTYKVPDQPKDDEVPTADVKLDMDLTEAWLEYDYEKIENNTVDNNSDLNIFDGDGSTKFTWTENLGSNAEVTVRFGKKYKAENYLQIAMKLAVGNWVEENKVTITVYSLTDTNNSHPLASFSAAGSKTKGNIIGYVVFDAKDVADSESYIGGFRLVKTQTDDTKQGQIFADDVTLIIVPTAAPEENVIVDFDGQGAWLDGRQDKITADNNTDLPFFVKYGADGTTKQTWTEKETEEGITSYTIKLGRKYKAKFFDYVKIRIGASNWDGENTVTVSGYGAGEDAKNAGSVKFGYGNNAKTLKLKAAPLADADGYISEIVIKRTHSGVNKKVQLAFDYVEFCLVGSEPEPVVAGEYIEKDISEVMPVGAGKEFSLASDEEKLNDVSVAASCKTASYDKLTFALTPNYVGTFSAYVLMKASAAGDTHENGGIFFWFTDYSVSVGATSAGSTNSEEIPLTDLPEGTFASGKATKISVAAIPYYIEGVQEGYYCAVYIDGSEKAVVEIYLENAFVTTGVYTNVCIQDVGNDASVKLSSTKENPVPAADIMKVTIATTSGKSEFKTPRAGLTLSHFEVAGEIVGDLVIEGDATFDKDTKFLTFTKEGTVKVYYTVKNAFGEFKSNELSLTYVTEKPSDSGDSSGNGCFGTVSGTSVLFAIAGIAAAAAIAKKKKND